MRTTVPKKIKVGNKGKNEGEKAPDDPTRYYNEFLFIPENKPPKWAMPKHYGEFNIYKKKPKDIQSFVPQRGVQPFNMKDPFFYKRYIEEINDEERHKPTDDIGKQKNMTHHGVTQVKVARPFVGVRNYDLTDEQKNGIRKSVNYGYVPPQGMRGDNDMALDLINYVKKPTHFYYPTESFGDMGAMGGGIGAGVIASGEMRHTRKNAEYHISMTPIMDTVVQGRTPVPQSYTREKYVSEVNERGNGNFEYKGGAGPAPLVYNTTNKTRIGGGDGGIPTVPHVPNRGDERGGRLGKYRQSTVGDVGMTSLPQHGAEHGAVWDRRDATQVMGAGYMGGISRRNDEDPRQYVDRNSTQIGERMYSTLPMPADRSVTKEYLRGHHEYERGNDQTPMTMPMKLAGNVPEQKASRMTMSDTVVGRGGINARAKVMGGEGEGMRGGRGHAGTGTSTAVIRPTLSMFRDTEDTYVRTRENKRGGYGPKDTAMITYA